MLSNRFKNSKGYTLLFSVIVSTIVLSIAAFVITISRKQFILSSMARDSTVAIYAADSAIQCAVAAYANNGLIEYNEGEQIPRTASISCGGQNAGSAFTVNPNLPTEFRFKNNNAYETGDMQFYFDDNKTCVKVKIYDGEYEVGNKKKHKVLIESRGYNLANAGSCPIANPRSTERAIRLEYYD